MVISSEAGRQWCEINVKSVRAGGKREERKVMDVGVVWLWESFEIKSNEITLN